MGKKKKGGRERKRRREGGRGVGRLKTLKHGLVLAKVL